MKNKENIFKIVIKKRYVGLEKKGFRIDLNIRRCEFRIFERNSPKVIRSIFNVFVACKYSERCTRNE